MCQCLLALAHQRAKLQEGVLVSSTPGQQLPACRPHLTPCLRPLPTYPPAGPGGGGAHGCGGAGLGHRVHGVSGKGAAGQEGVAGGRGRPGLRCARSMFLGRIVHRSLRTQSAAAAACRKAQQPLLPLVRASKQPVVERPLLTFFRPPALNTGFLFALGLGVAGMTKPTKVASFLSLQDVSLAFVMVSRWRGWLFCSSPSPPAPLGCTP